MTHEFKHIIESCIKAKTKSLKSVLASVVHLDGSSYRQPGVRMLILENGNTIGAVSGGCVEKEIILQAQSVFTTGVSKIMTYNGRYRLGCKGVLYILLEELIFTQAFETAFFQCLNNRNPFEIVSYYKKHAGSFKTIGTNVKIKDKCFNLSKNVYKDSSFSVCRQIMSPCFKLIIFGAEHDALQLCNYAKLTGWEVTVVADVLESKNLQNFKSATNVIAVKPEDFNTGLVDAQTAIVLMTHVFSKDLRFLVALQQTNPSYIGLLGPTKRREDMLSQLIEYSANVTDKFLELVYGPSGLDIGSITPQEIAISIVSEILAVTRNRNAKPLNQKSGRIHQK